MRGGEGMKDSSEIMLYVLGFIAGIVVSGIILWLIL